MPAEKDRFWQGAPEGTNPGLQRTLTRATLLEKAQRVEVVIYGISMTADVKPFSTGPLDWRLTGKTNLKVGKKSVSIQIGMNLTIVRSKALPKEYAGFSSRLGNAPPARSWAHLVSSTPRGAFGGLRYSRNHRAVVPAPGPQTGYGLPL